MSTVQLKRSAVASKVPITTDVALGELALNTYDGRLFFKKDSGVPAIVTVVTTADTQTLTNKTLTAAVMSGNTVFDTNTLFIDSTNDRVGIGNTTPVSKLTVTGNAEISTTLSVGANASITGNLTVNTITSGTWNGTAVGVGYGGTNIATYAIGDILYASGTATLSKLADVATGNALISGGVGVAPSYGKIGLTTHVTGVLPVSNGGTGVGTSTGTGSVVLSAAPAFTGNTTFNSTTLVIDATNGRVGIGNTTPSVALEVTGNIKDTLGLVRAAPIQTKSVAYVVVAADAGATIYISTGGVTINASILSAGDMITIVNNSASNQTITAGASVTFRLAGTATTGNRTLAQYGMATFLCVVGGATPTLHCSGAGLS